MDSSASSSYSSSDDEWEPAIESSAVVAAGLDWDTNRPWRRRCEDTHVLKLGFNGSKSSCLFAIFDGHASKAAATYAEEHVPELLDSNLKKSVPDSTYVHPESSSLQFPKTTEDEPIQLKALRKTYKDVDNGLEECKVNWGGACAVTCLVQKDESGDRHLYVANCGDCRAILVRKGKAIRISFDHKVSDPEEQTRIKEAGGFIRQGRVNGTIAVTRSLGDLVMKKIIISDPYTRYEKITADDSHLVLACDGIWDVMTDQDIADFIVELKQPPKRWRHICRQLINLAKQKKSRDNLSIMIIKL